MKVSNLALFLMAGTTTPFSLVAGEQQTPCGQGPDRIQCHNGAVCITDQVADFSEFELSDGSYHDVHEPKFVHHCECPPGWTGELCNVPLENCNDGMHYCLHGGFCVPDQAYCDCSGAIDAHTGKRYVGKWCEHKEQDQYHCPTNGKADGTAFCLHGGECNPNFPLDQDEPCFCTSEYDGPHCEYKVDHGLPPLDLCEDFRCKNGGICKLGSGKGLNDDYAGFYGNDWDKDNVYCECPDGFHGQFCEVASDSCGNDRCYNGGQCLTLDSAYHCDCRVAGDNNVKFAGQYCQYKTEAETGDDSFCTDSNSLHGQLFCVNGGECREDEPYLGCDCPDGFEGFSCELWVGDDIEVAQETNQDDYYAANEGKVDEPLQDDYTNQEDYYIETEPTSGDFGEEPVQDDYTNQEDYYIEIEPTSGDFGEEPVQDDYAEVIDLEPGQDNYSSSICTLDCNGNGVCKKGAKDMGSLGVAAHGGNLGAAYNENFEHCVCIPGYVGLQCDEPVDVCGETKDFNNPEHFCLHGGTCRGNNEFGYSCDCTTARSNDPNYFFTGDHCHQPSVSCHVAELMDLLPNSFCANGGVCIDQIDKFGEPHPGCLCRSGWIGDFCEIWGESQSEYRDSELYTEETKTRGAVIGVPVAFLLVFCVLAIAFRCRPRRPSPGFRGFGMHRQYSKKFGFRRSFTAVHAKATAQPDDEAVRQSMRSIRRTSFVDIPIDQSNNLAPYSDNRTSDGEDDIEEKGDYLEAVSDGSEEGSDAEEEDTRADENEGIV